jgi:hypothetical protein
VVAEHLHDVLGRDRALGFHGERVVIAPGVGLRGQVEGGRGQRKDAPHAASRVVRVGAHGRVGLQKVEFFATGLGPETGAFRHLEDVLRVQKVVVGRVDFADHEGVRDSRHLCVQCVNGRQADRQTGTQTNYRGRGLEAFTKTQTNFTIYTSCSIKHICVKICYKALSYNVKQCRAVCTHTFT